MVSRLYWSMKIEVFLLKLKSLRILRQNVWNRSRKNGSRSNWIPGQDQGYRFQCHCYHLILIESFVNKERWWMIEDWEQASEMKDWSVVFVDKNVFDRIAQGEGQRWLIVTSFFSSLWPHANFTVAALFSKTISLSSSRSWQQKRNYRWCRLSCRSSSHRFFLFISPGTIFGIGNPLLDISVEVPVTFLEGSVPRNFSRSDRMNIVRRFRYKLKCNDAILATDEHKDLFVQWKISDRSMKRDHFLHLEMKLFFAIIPIINSLLEVQHKTRCVLQRFDLKTKKSSIRCHSILLQWLLQQPGVCVYMGCVGQDKYHQLLHDAASQAGLTLCYQVQHKTDENIPTGTCAVLINGANR